MSTGASKTSSSLDDCLAASATIPEAVVLFRGQNECTLLERKIFLEGLGGGLRLDIEEVVPQMDTLFSLWSMLIKNLAMLF